MEDLGASRYRRSPAVRWLLERYSGTSPSAILARLMQALLHEGRQYNPPYGVYEIAKYRRVTKILRAELSHDALLIPVANGFLLKLNKAQPAVRLRFSCAHELAHTFFYDLKDGKPRRPYSIGDYDLLEETLCQEAAEDLLMPAPDMVNLIEPLGQPSIESFARVMATFQVSAQAAATRLRRLGLWNATIIGWKQTPTNPGEIEEHDSTIDCGSQIQVAWFTKPEKVNTGLRINQIVEDSNRSLSSHLSGGFAKGVLDLSIGKLKGPHWVESMSFRGRQTRAVSIIRALDKLDKWEAPNQMSSADGFVQPRLF